MSFYKTDHSQAGNTDFEVLPVGKYECFIESGEPKKASTGSDGIEFVLKVRDDVEGQSYGGRKVWYRLWFTPNTDGIVQGFLKAIGAPDGKEFPTIKEFADYAVGRAVQANVKHREYQGKTYEDVNYLNASAVGGGKIDSPFDEQPMADPFAETAGTVEVDDDDLPF